MRGIGGKRVEVISYFGEEKRFAINLNCHKFAFFQVIECCNFYEVRHQIPLPWTGRIAPVTPSLAGVTRKMAASTICSVLTHFLIMSSAVGFIDARFD